MNENASKVATALDAGSVADLRHVLTGDVLTPSDPRYDSTRRVWNHEFDPHPALITMCATEEDVLRSIEFARKKELVVAVRSGGHSFAGYGACDDGLVINLSQMKRVQFDARAATVRIESGVRAGELDQVTQAFGLAAPLGTCPMVGVAGYALGGGESSLTTKIGFGCDSILAASLVTADGRRLHASESENPELFWALRGGGPNFGVVTSIDFRLHRIDKVLSGHLKYPICLTKDVLKFVDEYVQGIPDELYIIATVLPRPGERMLDVAVVWSGEQREGVRVLRPLREFTKASEDTIEPKPYLVEQQSGSDSPAEGDWCSYRKAGHMRRLTCDPIEVIADHAASGSTETCGITLVYWHGQWCSHSRDDAFGFRRIGYEYWIHSYWQNPDDREKSHAWVDEFYERLEPFSTGAVYVNDLMREGEQRVRAAYGDKYERLRRIKSKYDPDNFFRVNQNLKPSLES